jgi:hypothetical protein
MSMIKSMGDETFQRAMESGGAPPDVLVGFRANRRVLVLSALAVPIFVIGALAGSRFKCSKMKTI